MADANQNRILYHQTFDGEKFTNENSLVNALMTRPDEIDPVITHLVGKEEDKFPLSFLSEGQLGGSVEVGDIQYNWPVIGRLRKNDHVVSTTYTAGDNPGINNQPFFVTFKSNWLKKDHTIESPFGDRARILSVQKDGLHHTYKLELWTTDPARSCSLQSLQPGTAWGMVGGANVSESLSRGNESNRVMPGKLRNQLSFLRKSYAIAGNISNRTVECQFNIGGKTSNLWINFEQWQHMLNWKQDVEEHLWYAEYNRNENGRIVQKDHETNQPIPVCSGVLEQIPNSDTFGILTEKKLKNIVRDVLFGATGDTKRNIVLFTGTGGFDDFDTAMKAGGQNLGFSLVDQSKFISGSPMSLTFGGYFTQYRHVDGHTITLKKLPLLDEGGRADVARKHPVSGLPITSHHMYFIDMTNYDGKRNVAIAHQKNRSMVTGVLRGMTPIKGFEWAGNNTNINLATDQDIASIHFMCSKSIFIRRNTHCFKLECVLA
jgi:hypothetical protein